MIKAATAPQRLESGHASHGVLLQYRLFFVTDDDGFPLGLPLCKPQISLLVTDARMTDKGLLGTYSHKLHPPHKGEKATAGVDRSFEGPGNPAVEAPKSWKPNSLSPYE